MGGTIRIDSTPGKGTVFTVELPLRLPHEEEDEHFREHHHITRMLLVDDDKNICNGIKENMKDSGVEFDAVYSGENAVSLVKKEYAAGKEYSAIILDWQMPEMNGYEATEKIRASKHPEALTVPIVAMTANAFVKDVQDALNAGMNAHIAKPISMETLKNTLNSCIRR